MASGTAAAPLSRSPAPTQAQITSTLTKRCKKQVLSEAQIANEAHYLSPNRCKTFLTYQHSKIPIGATESVAYPFHTSLVNITSYYINTYIQ